MKAIRSFVIGLICLGGCIGLAEATPYYVKLDGNDSNDGLSWATARATPNGGVALAAVTGDEVIISNGVYVLTNEVSITKGITIRSSANDYNSVVFDGGGVRRCLALSSAATNSQISGITFTNGYASDGGGIQIAGTGHGGTVVSNCLVTRCSSPARGGGVRMNSGRLVNCMIISNSAASYGGGVDNITGPISLRGCAIGKNTAASGGAGIMLQSSQTNEVFNCQIFENGAMEGVLLYASAVALISGCEFRNNAGRALAGDYAPLVTNCTFVGNQGGGLSLTYATLVVDCTFVSNRAANGGAISMTDNQVIDRCVMTHNYASSSGGGIHMGGGTVRNSRIEGNEVSASGYGGGIRAITSAKGQIENCTIVGNKALSSSRGGGVFFQNSGAAVTNSIVMFNLDGGTSSNYYEFTGGAMLFAYSCTMPAPTAGADGGGNVANNPLFMTDGFGYGTNFLLGDLQLQGSSPCKNTGSNLVWMTFAVDLAKKARIAMSRVDMGAYEFIAGLNGLMVQIQ